MAGGVCSAFLCKTAVLKGSQTPASPAQVFVGVGASRVRDMFKKARASAPCILFIDEFDGIGQQRSSSAMGNDGRCSVLPSQRCMVRIGHLAPACQCIPGMLAGAGAALYAALLACRLRRSCAP